MAADPWAEFRVSAPAPAAADAWAEFRLPEKGVADTALGLAKAGGTGVLKGGVGLAGVLGDSFDAGQSIYGALANKTSWLPQAAQGSTMVGDNPQTSVGKAYKAVSDMISLPRSEPVKKAVETATGPLYEPQTRGERYAQNIGEFVPGAAAAAAGPGGWLRFIGNTAKYAVLPGAASEFAAEKAKGTSYEPYARVAGALAGIAAPSALKRAVTPMPISEGRQAMVDALKKEGVTSLTAGQVTGSEPLRYAESMFGAFPLAGSRAKRVQEQGQRQFTEAATRRAGADASLAPEGMGAASPEVLSANQARLGREFQDISARNNLKFDQQFVTDARAAIRDYDQVVPSQQKSVIEKYVNDIATHMQTGQMPGAEYQKLRSRLSTQANRQRGVDEDYAAALRGLRDSLDNAFRRSVTGQDAQRLDLARSQYRAQKTLEKAASRAGEVTAEGNITPANLRNTVAVGADRGQYARGEGKFAELARAGNVAMTPLPNSGTAQRMNVLAAIATLGVPAVVGRTLMSSPVQGYLKGQTGLQRAINSLPPDEKRKAAAIAAMLTGQNVPRLEAK